MRTRRVKASPEPASELEAMEISDKLHKEAREFIYDKGRKRSIAKRDREAMTACVVATREAVEEMVKRLFDPERCVVIRQLPAEFMSDDGASSLAPTSPECRSRREPSSAVS